MFHFQAFVDTLPIMGMGMLSIFGVMLAIGGVIMLLNRLTKGKGGDE